MLHALQRRLTYFPDRTAPRAADDVRDVTLTTADGLRLTAWQIEPSTADGAAVLVAPGNGGNRAGRLPLARQLAAEGLTVLLLDYRGYGGNPGTPSEAGLARDVRAAWDHLRGRSIGSSCSGRVSVPPSSLGWRPTLPRTASCSARRSSRSWRSGGRTTPFLPVGALLRG